MIAFLFQIITTVTVQTEDSMAFPAVTLCNYNQVHCGNLHDYIEDCNRNSSCPEVGLSLLHEWKFLYPMKIVRHRHLSIRVLNNRKRLGGMLCAG